MEFKDQLNQKCIETADAMRKKGFHEDDRFMEDLANHLYQWGYIDSGQHDRFLGTWDRNRRLARIALIHSELSEMVEGIRKDSMDDKLPRRKQEEVELADTLIRMEDYAGIYGLDLGGAREEKEAYNSTREYKHGKNI